MIERYAIIDFGGLFMFIDTHCHLTKEDKIDELINKDVLKMG